MDNWKEASRLKLRLNTIKGELSPEQLWGLKKAEVALALRAVKKILKKNDDDDLAFLDENHEVDTLNQLRFEILKDVYVTMKQEENDARTAKEVKDFNESILRRIAANNEKALDSLSNEELMKLLK